MPQTIRSRAPDDPPAFGHRGCLVSEHPTRTLAGRVAERLITTSVQGGHGGRAKQSLAGGLREGWPMATESQLTFDSADPEAAADSRPLSLSRSLTWVCRLGVLDPGGIPH